MTSPTTSPEAGKKFDAGKRRWDLVPWDALGLVVDVLTDGAKKYGDRNWEQGLNYSRLFAATMRHLTDWFVGITFDRESGRSALAHAACDILMMLALANRGMYEFDDRPSELQASALREQKREFAQEVANLEQQAILEMERLASTTELAPAHEIDGQYVP